MQSIVKTYAQEICNQNLLRSYRSYKISELCRIFRDKKLHPQTLREWIKLGKIEAIQDGKDFLIYGAIFKKFLIANNDKKKQPLQFREFKCWKCKTSFEPQNNQVAEITSNKNKFIIIKCHCPKCNHLTSKNYANDNQQEINEIFQVKQSEALALSDSYNSTGKTHYNKEPRKALSESSKAKVIKSTNSTNKTSIKQQQTDFFHLLSI